MKIATVMLLALMIVVPTVPLLSDPPQRDNSFDMKRATQNLEDAKNYLKIAGAEWGGHREAAVKHIDAALAELAQAEKWAKEHHDVK